jgi:hypothetical protein
MASVIEQADPVMRPSFDARGPSPKTHPAATKKASLRMNVLQAQKEFVVEFAKLRAAAAFA